MLITGAGDGIGRIAAFTFAKYGAQVFLVSRNENKLKSLQKAIFKAGYRKAEFFVMDIKDVNSYSYKLLTKKITKNFTYLDGLLNNAGILGQINPIINQNVKSWLEVISVNVNGTFLITKTLLPFLLKSKNSSIIFTTSTVGREGRANWGAYSVSKFATEGMMQILSKEYHISKLRVNCINPGAVRTNMRLKAFPSEDLNKLLNPSDIMSIYLYLMGQDSYFKTGISFDAQ